MGFTTEVECSLNFIEPSINQQIALPYMCQEGESSLFNSSQPSFLESFTQLIQIGHLGGNYLSFNPFSMQN
jgi:hypothetical protein